MNNEENQHLDEPGLRHVWWVGAFVFVLAMAPLSLTAPSDKNLRAQAKAEVLAYQVAQLYRENVQSSSTQVGLHSAGPAQFRHPASIQGSSSGSSGVMGRDPWGRPYRYSVQEDPDSKLQVEMASAGPDGVFSDDAQSDDIRLMLSF